MKEVPVLDLSTMDDSELVEAIASACSTFGFFQVVGHGIPISLMDEFRTKGMGYLKSSIYKPRRNETNARGFFDDELTKQKRDWKLALDVGVPGSRDWNVPDNDLSNACLDGFNQFPDDDDTLRDVVVRYFEACTILSDRLAQLMARGIIAGSPTSTMDTTTMIDDLRSNHTSYLRLNYYPPCDKENELGISPHRDAGFLTVLLQDDDCHSLQVYYNDEWHSIAPIPGALTINTGDMAQIWSNGVYQAPLHRVLTHSKKERFSAPFFYNPGYNTYVAPIGSQERDKAIQYHPCLWGYFRALRFAGDLTDLGLEIQVSDYETNMADPSIHLKRQAVIGKYFKWDEPFSVARLRKLLEHSDL